MRRRYCGAQRAHEPHEHTVEHAWDFRLCSGLDDDVVDCPEIDPVEGRDGRERRPRVLEPPNNDDELLTFYRNSQVRRTTSVDRELAQRVALT